MFEQDAEFSVGMIDLGYGFPVCEQQRHCAGTTAASSPRPDVIRIARLPGAGKAQRQDPAARSDCVDVRMPQPMRMRCVLYHLGDLLPRKDKKRAVSKRLVERRDIGEMLVVGDDETLIAVALVPGRSLERRRIGVRSLESRRVRMRFATIPMRFGVARRRSVRLEGQPVPQPKARDGRASHDATAQA